MLLVHGGGIEEGGDFRLQKGSDSYTIHDDLFMFKALNLKFYESNLHENCFIAS